MDSATSKSSVKNVRDLSGIGDDDEEQSDVCANLCANRLLVSYHSSNVRVVSSVPLNAQPVPDLVWFSYKLCFGFQPRL